MPIYSYQCGTCKKITDAFRRYEDRERAEPCECGATGLATRVFTVPTILPDIPEYESPATGKWIRGRKQQREDLRVSGCRLAEKDEAKYAARKAAEAKKEFEKENERIFDAAAKDLGINVG